MTEREFTGRSDHLSDHCQCFPLGDCTLFACEGVRDKMQKKGSRFCGRDHAARNDYSHRYLFWVDLFRKCNFFTCRFCLWIDSLEDDRFRCLSSVNFCESI